MILELDEVLELGKAAVRADLGMQPDDPVSVGAAGVGATIAVFYGAHARAALGREDIDSAWRCLEQVIAYSELVQAAVKVERPDDDPIQDLEKIAKHMSKRPEVGPLDGALTPEELENLVE